MAEHDTIDKAVNLLRKVTPTMRCARIIRSMEEI